MSLAIGDRVIVTVGREEAEGRIVRVDLVTVEVALDDGRTVVRTMEEVRRP